MGKMQVFYFSGTHWDREWYQTFQGFRIKLERVLKELICFLEENPDFTTFYLDGQTIVLDDFLEVAPDYGERLRSLICAGRILIGPWYCMPDEFLVSGEAMIKNLQMGHKKAIEHGAQSAWKMGYICDIFGHTSQFPQILNGFGITDAVLGRGTNEQTTKMFFRWQSPDGSECVVYKVPDYSGYGAFSLEVVGQRQKNEELHPNSAAFEKKCKVFLDRIVQNTDVPYLVIADAMDHEPVHKFTKEYIKKIGEMYPDWHIKHGSMDELFEKLKGCNLQVRRGELIDTVKEDSKYLHLLTNTLSSRYDIKSRNDLCQDIMEKWLEPFAAYMKNEGLTVSQGYAEIAWKNLIQNHPHDSICGCGIDRIHKEMGYRFSQVESISEAVTQETLVLKTGEFKAIGSENNLINIIQFNTYKAFKTVTVDVPFEIGYPSYHEPFGYEEINCFRLYDCDGNEIPYRIEKFVKNVNMRSKSEETKKVDIYTLTFGLELKPFGATVIRVVPSNKAVRFGGSTALLDGSLENAFIKAEVENDGRLTVYNKKTGKTYKNLMGIVSDGEIGDGWYSVRPACGTKNVKTVLKRVDILTNNLSGASVRVLRTMSVPSKADYSATGIIRSEIIAEIEIDTVYTLNEKDDFISVKMEINNTAKDQRLRLILPTDTNSKTYQASQSFCFIERNAGINAETLDYQEPEQLEKNMRGIVLRKDNSERGLAFLSKYGLCEAACANDDRATILITLLRGFSKTFTTNGEHDGQMQGKNVYEFVLKPLDGDSFSLLQKLQDDIKRPYYMFVLNEDCKLSNSMISTEGNCNVSIIKRSSDGDGIIMRLYNTENSMQNFKIFAPMLSNAYLCDLLETEKERLNYENDVIELIVPPYKIMTIKIKINIYLTPKI